MRKITFTIPILLGVFVAIFFVGDLFSNNVEDPVEELQQERNWYLNSICDVRLMNIESDRFSFSDAQSSLLTNRLQNGDLKLSCEIQLCSNLKLDGLKSVDAEIEFPQLKISQPLKILSVSDSQMIAKLDVDLAKYYDGKNKDALFAAVSSLASNKGMKIKPSFEDFEHEKNDWVKVENRQ
ncbi:MAG: hypothetical protein KBT22_00535 [Bacteroidales bacterium]|nr:hypothetical protein [Candidatus Scybalocola fimicaballi]